ncbi:hypothetical protein [Microbulbifer taiwanensis]|uniref:DUF3649 domain-containing protein n=1 Tax=Microbulbifer taiwanensis TaxID=986746 RepID=A0ABW1YJ55_9GAMM|nr:hypothetical protein [Microbulbifer taiwanensis]
MELTGWRLLALAAPALLGGYALATASGIFLVGLLPVPLGEAVLAGNLLGFACYAVAVIWVFALRRPVRAWLQLLLASGILAASGLLLRGQLL